MFSRKANTTGYARERGDAARNYLLVLDGRGGRTDPADQRIFQAAIPENALCSLHDDPAPGSRELQRTDFVLSLFADAASLDRIADAVIAAREAGAATTLVVAVRPGQLVMLGSWLARRADSQRLAGIRLLVARDVADVAQQLPDRLQPVVEANVIRMPSSTEIEDSPVSSFFCFSPSMQALVSRIRGFAENGIQRAYLLGGPGSGKTSLAYYYYLARRRGRFVSVNLLSEDTGDKAAVKSLLCGHVPGAFPGAGARAGAFDVAQDGVCFLDESHGVMDAVMETLMEALDNAQYMPYGAAAKRPLRCALVFATNRSWEHVQASVNIDELTRLGAATLQVPPLREREEDMIAVTATCLARLAAPCTSWTPPAGLSDAAWRQLRECPWHGNARALIRSLEAAFVETAPDADAGGLIGEDAIARGIRQWEPQSHHSHELFGSREARSAA